MTDIIWYLGGTIASPSFKERNSFPGAIRPLKNFYNTGPLGLQGDKLLK